MIIRQGISVQYSHDDEALLSWLVTLREFSGVEPNVIWQWLLEIYDFSFNAEYYVHEDDLEDNGGHAGFQSTRTFLYCHPDVRAKLRTVTLWKPEETARYLLENRGYSCVICGARCEWSEHPLWWQVGREASDPLHDRQGIVAPPLICKPCTRLLGCLSGDVKPAYSDDRIVETVIDRIQPMVSTP